MLRLTWVDFSVCGAAYSGGTMSIQALEQTSGRYPRLPCTIVTGATSGIGRALAIQLAEAGIPVIAIGRNLDQLRALAAHSGLMATYAADLGEIDCLPALAARIVSDHPGVGCLINNAGIQNDLRMDDASCDGGKIRHEVDVNLIAPMVLTHALLPHLQSKRLSWVVNVTSGLGYAPKRTAAVYSATKAGLHLFSQALRVQMQGATIRVVEVVLPLVDTPMTAGRGSGKLSAAHVAHQLIEGLLAGKPDIRIGKARWLPWLQRWAPSVLASILQRG
jgi:uncharacterized oxidoreductase